MDLLSIGKDAKTIKGEKFGVLTAINLMYALMIRPVLLWHYMPKVKPAGINRGS